MRLDHIPGNISKYYGLQVTASVLAKDITGTIFFQNQTGTGIPIKAGLSSMTFTFDSNSAYTFAIRFYNGTPNASATLVAVKLELGSQQTLAHQDTDGNWVLNDPPNYDLQYALCSLYNPITGEWVGSQHSNLNLFDNWYFLDPINQRGQTEYKDCAYRYTIDRLKANAGTVSLTANGLQFVGNPNIAGNDGDRKIFQVISAKDLPIGTPGTFSVLTDSGLYSMPVIFGSVKKYNFGTVELETGPMSSINLYFFLLRKMDNSPITIKAMKLELGSQQTLAHQDADGNWILNDPPPNKTLELAKCQRYYVNTTASYSPGRGFLVRPVNPSRLSSINFPVEMRTTPTVTLYSAASADHETQNAISRWDNNQTIPNVFAMYRSNMGFIAGKKEADETMFLLDTGYILNYIASAEL